MINKKLVMCLILLFGLIALYGVKEETRGDIWNGTPYALFVVTSLSIISGLIFILFSKQNKTAGSWIILVTMYAFLYFIGVVLHYGGTWFPESLIFLGVECFIYYVLLLFLRGEKGD